MSPNIEPLEERITPLVVDTANVWAHGPRLNVYFIDAPPALAAPILREMNAWWRSGVNARFAWYPTADAPIRISVLGQDGFSSWVGRENLLHRFGATTSLQGVTLANVKSLAPGIAHEAGHILGFSDELGNPALQRDLIRSRVYQSLWEQYGLDASDSAELLVPALPPRYLSSPADRLSVMNNVWLPANVTRSGLGVPGGVEPSAIDAAFAERWYGRT